MLSKLILGGGSVKKYFDVCYLETFERWDFSNEKEERPRGVEREIASCFFELNKSVIFELEVNKSVVIFFGFGPVVLRDTRQKYNILVKIATT